MSGSPDHHYRAANDGEQRTHGVAGEAVMHRVYKISDLPDSVSKKGLAGLHSSCWKQKIRNGAEEDDG